jgi:fermentation-respiration switch protein FrsA (DUF1100 family)
LTGPFFPSVPLSWLVRSSDFRPLLPLKEPAASLTQPLTLPLLLFLTTGVSFSLAVLLLYARRGAQRKWGPRLEKGRNQPLGLFNIGHSG